jgi:hypothetical protein
MTTTAATMTAALFQASSSSSPIRDADAGPDDAQVLVYKSRSRGDDGGGISYLLLRMPPGISFFPWG